MIMGGLIVMATIASLRTSHWQPLGSLKNTELLILVSELLILVSELKVSHEWHGMPAGVKFDPSEVELLQHLSAKCSVESSRPHTFIDEFITTLEQGICYTHPKNLPRSYIIAYIFN